MERLDIQAMTDFTPLAKQKMLRRLVAGVTFLESSGVVLWARIKFDATFVQSKYHSFKY